MEENVLFPAFEKAIEITADPTMVMKNEHRQMHQLIAEIERAMPTLKNK